MKNKIILLPLVTAAALVLPTTNSQARGCSNQLVDLAHQIERQGADLKREFQAHYRYSGAYRHLISDINQFLVKAEHIDQLAHDPRTSYRHIKADVADLDKLAHHIHEVVDNVERGRFSGRCNANLAHVHQKLTALNNTIHQLQRAIEVYARPVPSCGNSYSRYDQPARSVRNVRSSRQNDWSRYFGGWLNSRFGW